MDRKNKYQVSVAQLNGKTSFNIVIIISTQCFFPQIGGIESLMTGMAEGLAEYDKEVFVIADGKTQPSDINQPYQIKRFNNWKPIRRIQKALFIKKICKQHKIEAIYSDSWKSVEYLGGLKEKIFILAHGTEIPKKSAQKSIRNRIKRQRVKSTFKFATKIIGSSTYTKDLLQASLSIDGDKIIVIHPGVDIYKKKKIRSSKVFGIPNQIRQLGAFRAAAAPLDPVAIDAAGDNVADEDVVAELRRPVIVLVENDAAQAA